MALRLTCNRLMRTAASKSTAQRFQAMALRSFGAESPAMEPGAPAPSIMDKIISLTIVDPSGARRKINGVVGKFRKDYSGVEVPATFSSKPISASHQTIFLFCILSTCVFVVLALYCYH